MLSSRERFQRMGIDIPPGAWIGGHAPACICFDRGSELTAKATLKLLAVELKISPTILPPLAPDGKAIIERVIRTIKQRTSERLKGRGGYADKPTKSPRASKQYRQAVRASVTSLVDLYRELIEIVMDHNTRPHKTLEKYTLLSEHGIPAVPRAAFLWGAEHISGLTVSSISDDDMRRLTMREDVAAAGAHVLRYKDNPYVPVNAQAQRLADGWKKSKPIQILVDELGGEVWVPVARKWAIFRLPPGATDIRGGRTIEEQVLHAPHARRRATVESNKSQIRRAKQAGSGSGPRRSRVARKVSRSEQLALRRRETRKLKHLLASPVNEATDHPAPPQRTRPKPMEDFERQLLEAQISEIRRTARAR